MFKRISKYREDPHHCTKEKPEFVPIERKTGTMQVNDFLSVAPFFTLSLYLDHLKDKPSGRRSLFQRSGKDAAAMHWPTALKWSSPVWSSIFGRSGNSVSSTFLAISNMTSPPLPLLTRPRTITWSIL